MPGFTHDHSELVASIPTPVLTDAVIRLGLPVRQAPAGIAGRPPDAAVVGRALPVRHSGSVDVFLEALGDVVAGDVMVIDNAGRRDEACVGDLVAHEALEAGVAGIVIWGLHRDAVEIDELGLPIFSYGTVPNGPLEPRPPLEDRLMSARFGESTVTPSDVVAADPNGVLFLLGDELDRIASVAASIRHAETEQIRRLKAGTSLREQFDFDVYLQDRERDPGRTFRQHLRETRPGHRGVGVDGARRHRRRTTSGRQYRPRWIDAGERLHPRHRKVGSGLAMIHGAHAKEEV